MRSAIAFLACAAILALVDFSIAGKERQLASGKAVYLDFHDAFDVARKRAA